VSGNLEIGLAVLEHLAFTAAPAAAAIALAMRRGARSVALLLCIAMAASGVAAYLSFWAYYADPSVGRAWGWLLLLASLAVLVRGWREGGLDRALLRRLAFPFGLWALASLFVAFLGFLHGGESVGISTAAVRFTGQLPSDDDIPRFFAEWFATYGHHGIPPTYPGGWLMSDRPPLQIGYILSQRPFSHDTLALHYELLCIVVQQLWILGMWAVLCAVPLRPATRRLAIFAAVVSDVAIVHGFYVWPKLIAAAFALAALALVLSPQWADSRRRPLYGVLFAALCALSMLSHGASAFFVVPLLVFAVLRGLPSGRWIAAAALSALVLYVPWTAYQHFANPPGNYLIKWQIAGDPAHDDKGVLQTFADDYGDAGIGGTLENKYDNFREMTGIPRLADEGGKAVEAIGEGRFSYAIERLRNLRFFDLLPLLGVFLAAPFAMLLARRRGPREDPEWRFAVTSLLLVLGNCAFWGLALWGGDVSIAVLHAGSLALPLLAIVACVVALRATHPRLAAALVAVNVAIVLVLYVPPLTTIPGSSFSPLAALLAAASLAGIAFACFAPAGSLFETAAARLRRQPWLLALAVALLAGAVVLLKLSGGLTFFEDTWEYLLTRRELTLDALMRPHNEHIVVIPVLIEQLLVRAFGMGSARPEYVVLVLLLLAASAVLFAYVRRRLGPWPALMAAVLLLLVGPAWQVLLWPFEIGFVGSVLFGIAALLALDRGDRDGDLAACLFLAVGIGFSSLGVAFALGALLDVVLRRRELGLRRAYLALVPLALYAIWWAGWGHTAESHVSLHNVVRSPVFVFEGLAASLDSLLGLSTVDVFGHGSPKWGIPLLLAALLGIALAQWRRPGVSPRLWPVLGAAAAFWLLAAFNYIPGRAADSSRYMYAGGAFALLLAADLLGGRRPSPAGRGAGALIPPPALLAAGVVTLVAVAANVQMLRNGREFLSAETVMTRSDLASLEIAADRVRPDFRLTPEVAGSYFLFDVTAGDYLDAVREYGSPAYTPAELASAPERGRRQADVVLAQALPITTETSAGRRPPPGRCVALAGGDRRPVPVRPGTTAVELSPGPHADISLRRFAASEYGVRTEGAPGGSTTLLRIPSDRSPRPWQLRLNATQEARVCRGA
jgi:hypothetical protein